MTKSNHDTLSYEPYILQRKIKQNEDVYTFQFTPTNKVKKYSFLPGQYCYIKNPLSTKPLEAHAFSFASEPSSPFLEFSIRTYGAWTKQLAAVQPGNLLKLSTPIGNCVWKDTHSQVVFMAGGVGISAIMSMLRHIYTHKIKVDAVLFYGNRTLDTVLYAKEIEVLQKEMLSLKVVHVLSEVATSSIGYSGFITENIINNEIDIRKDYDFFLCGPPIFITNTKKIIEDLGIRASRIHDELDCRAQVS